MTVEKKLNGTVVRLQEGDLTALPVDAFVFYAREDLALGSGFGTALQTRGGDTIKKELAAIGAVRPGEAVVTSAGRMQAKHVIHACGPKFQEPETDKKLRDCMLSALSLASHKGLKTIAFPPMGAGFYGVPLATCVDVMLEAIRSFLKGESSLEEVVICVMDRREFEAFEAKLNKLSN